jgi:hypothetical protein
MSATWSTPRWRNTTHIPLPASQEETARPSPPRDDRYPRRAAAAILDRPGATAVCRGVRAPAEDRDLLVRGNRAELRKARRCRSRSRCARSPPAWTLDADVVASPTQRYRKVFWGALGDGRARARASSTLRELSRKASARFGSRRWCGGEYASGTSLPATSPTASSARSRLPPSQRQTGSAESRTGGDATSPPLRHPHLPLQHSRQKSRGSFLSLAGRALGLIPPLLASFERRSLPHPATRTGRGARAARPVSPRRFRRGESAEGDQRPRRRATFRAARAWARCQRVIIWALQLADLPADAVVLPERPPAQARERVTGFARAEGLRGSGAGAS